MANLLDISIVIPVKGNCEYLSETLDSLCNIRTPVEEIIIVNDGVSNKALALISAYEKKLPIRLILSSGSGLVAALNSGLNSANCKHIARLDGDDLTLPDRFQLQLEAFEADPLLVACGGQIQYINQQSQITGASSYPVGKLNSLSIFRSRCLIAHPASMYLKSAAHEIGGYRSVFTERGMDLAEDFDFWLRISLLGNIENLSDTLIKYRQHPNQISTAYLPGQGLATTYVKALNQSKLPFDDSLRISLTTDSSVLTRSQFRVLQKSLNLFELMQFNIELLAYKRSSQASKAFWDIFLITILRIFRKLNSLKS